MGKVIFRNLLLSELTFRRQHLITSLQKLPGLWLRFPRLKGSLRLFFVPGPFCESSSLPWQGCTDSVIQNTLFFIGCFFTISS
ncbi:hypothetical protein LCGC14_0809090 [marine sediment metagenome]|uniref:Uncharacterized protein n=1 Tax=marine sediment metagenome TaxID=412755 RepID=A0A0F9S7D2_9ZZZZ